MTQSTAAQPTPPTPPLQLTATAYGWLGQFRAMASPCEILLGPCDELMARQYVQLPQQKHGGSKRNSALSSEFDFKPT